MFVFIAAFLQKLKKQKISERKSSSHVYSAPRTSEVSEDLTRFLSELQSL